MKRHIVIVGLSFLLAQEAQAMSCATQVIPVGTVLDGRLTNAVVPQVGPGVIRLTMSDSAGPVPAALYEPVYDEASSPPAYIRLCAVKSPADCVYANAVHRNGDTGWEGAAIAKSGGSTTDTIRFRLLTLADIPWHGPLTVTVSNVVDVQETLNPPVVTRPEVSWDISPSYALPTVGPGETTSLLTLPAPTGGSGTLRRVSGNPSGMSVTFDNVTEPLTLTRSAGQTTSFFMTAAPDAVPGEYSRVYEATLNCP